MGREASIEKNKKRRPFAQFIALLDSRTRDDHAELHGSIFPVDDPFWNTFTPPLDYNCRCNKRTLTQRQITSREWEVSSSKGKLVRSSFDLGKSENNRKVSVTGYRLSPTKTVFPHASFGFNPYKATYQPDLNKYKNTVAYQYVRATVFGEGFKRLVRGRSNKGWMPVAVLNQEMTKRLGAKNQTILLSADTVREHAKKINLKDYQSIQSKIDDISDNKLENIKIIPNPDNRQLLTWEEKGKHHMIALKILPNGENFFLTMGRVRKGNIKKYEERNK